jgi:hypothetical protein
MPERVSLLVPLTKPSIQLSIPTDMIKAFAVASATTLTTAENEAVDDLPSAGVAYFSFHGNEYFIATNNNEVVVMPNDAIVELVGITNIHHATNSLGVVTLFRPRLLALQL